jgi:hypothetical protein
MTAVNWMPKNYTNKDRNPNDPDIPISTQHTYRIFMHKKDPNKQIFQYSKSTKTYKNNRRHNVDHGMRTIVQRMPKSREKSKRKTHNMP